MGDNNSFIKLGYVGSGNGDAWDEKGHGKIIQIFIWHGAEINSIQFQYADENGKLVLSERHGINYGSKFDVVKLNYPAEYITWVSFQNYYYGFANTDNDLCSIRFGTNHGEYGPFGQSSRYSKEFIFQLGEDNQFDGFYGIVNSNIVKSIGAYMKPIKTLDSRVNENVVKLIKKEGGSLS